MEKKNKKTESSSSKVLKFSNDSDNDESTAQEKLEQIASSHENDDDNDDDDGSSDDDSSKTFVHCNCQPIQSTTGAWLVIDAQLSATRLEMIRIEPDLPVLLLSLVFDKKNMILNVILKCM